MLTIFKTKATSRVRRMTATREDVLKRRKMNTALTNKLLQTLENGIAINGRTIMDHLEIKEEDRKTFENDLQWGARNGVFKQFKDSDESKKVRNAVYMAFGNFNA